MSDNVSWFGFLFQIHVIRRYNEILSVCITCFWHMFGKESNLLFIIYKTVSAECVTIIAGLFKVNRSQIHEPQTFLLMGSVFWNNLVYHVYLI